MRFINALANAKTALCAAALMGFTLANLPSVATAQQTKNLNADGSLYGRLSAGAFQPTDTGYSITGTASGLGITASVNVNGDIKTKVGRSFAGAVGYKFGSFAIEGEIAHQKADLDEATLNASVTITSGGNTLNASGSATLDLEGSVSATSGMVNVLAMLPIGSSDFTPYLGAGVGGVDWEVKLNRISQGSNSLTVNGKESGTDLAASAIAGFDFKLGESVAGGLRYKYLWTDTGTAYTDDVTAHVFLASVKIAF